MMNLFNRSGQHQVLRPLCYGKLPLSKDFLKSRGGEAGRKFQDWLNHLDRMHGRPAVISQTQRILFIPGEGKNYLTGTVWDSSDAGGVRHFPFALLFEPSRRFLDVHADRPVHGNLALWEGLEQEYPTLATAQSPEEFYQHLRGIQLAVNNLEPSEDVKSFEAKAADVPVKELAEAMFGLDFLEDWTRLLWRCRCLLTGNGCHCSGARPAFGLRMPLAEGIPYPLQIDAWLGFLTEQAGGQLPVPSIIYPRESMKGPSSFSLVFRTLRDSDVSLLQEEIGNAEMTDVTAPGPDTSVSGFTDFAAAVRIWSDDPRADLRMILPRTGQECGGKPDTA